ncbi:MAG: hypothetical protein EPO55_07270 [Reyranella sp.]|nr:MAG: hypothetical protein EPO55_07270 [Reyranella sp.]
MGQVLHGCATTTEAVRRAIQHSQKSLRALAEARQLNERQNRTSRDRPDGIAFAITPFSLIASDGRTRWPTFGKATMPTLSNASTCRSIGPEFLPMK